MGGGGGVHVYIYIYNGWHERKKVIKVFPYEAKENGFLFLV